MQRCALRLAGAKAGAGSGTHAALPAAAAVRRPPQRQPALHQLRFSVPQRPHACDPPSASCLTCGMNPRRLPPGWSARSATWPRHARWARPRVRPPASRAAGSAACLPRSAQPCACSGVMSACPFSPHAQLARCSRPCSLHPACPVFGTTPCSPAWNPPAPAPRTWPQRGSCSRARRRRRATATRWWTGCAPPTRRRRQRLRSCAARCGG